MTLDRLPRIVADYEAHQRPSDEDTRWLIEQVIKSRVLSHAAMGWSPWSWMQGWLERNGQPR